MRVCVFCGASQGADPQFAATAVELGAALPGQGHELVFGGSSSGCMGLLANAALARGGRVVGVMPSQLIATEQRHAGVSEFEVVDTLAARKLRMFARSDAVLVLPGGTGTLDELLEALTMKRLGLIAHPIVLVNVGAFFEPLLGLLRHLVLTGFAAAAQQDLLRVVHDVPAAMRELCLAADCARVEPDRQA